jgi:hypothetical protein
MFDETGGDKNGGPVIKPYSLSEPRESFILFILWGCRTGVNKIGIKFTISWDIYGALEN